MRVKAKRSLKHLTKVKTAKWATEALRNYFNLCEKLISEAQMDVMAEKELNKKREKIMNMLGVYVHPIITLKTVNFLYDNIRDLRIKNGSIPLTNVLFQLQMLFDDIETYSEIYECEPKPMYTLTAVIEQKKKLNEKYKTLKLN